MSLRSAFNVGTNVTFVPVTFKCGDCLVVIKVFMWNDELVQGMPGLIPGSVRVKGDQNADIAQETTGELSSSMKGDYGGVFTTISVDRNGNLINHDIVGLLGDVLTEIRKMNVQLSMITDHEVSGSDIR